ncbi:MAG: alkaline phosphatase D family protein [Actinomycetota bacterium]|nr:alkaline phosphatase D family protein [Actinomycetota bacterium]
MTIQGNWDRTSLSRRRFLGWAGLGAGGLAFAASGLASGQALAKPFFRDDPFSLGVASGVPLPDGVVLWTRLAPEPLAEGGSGGLPPEAYGVRYEVAEDEGFSRVVRRGAVEAMPELAHSVHVEVGGLRPGREYFYRFKAGPEISPVGRTKTAPAFGAAIDQFTFAFASCQGFAAHYSAYHNMAREDLELVVHLGDYIYENTLGPNPRGLAIPEHVRTGPSTLEQYRLRYALYKTDESLQATHAMFPWLVTWDDHEVKNNWYGQDARPDFVKRLVAASQAYYEHLPLRASAKPSGPNMQLYRRAKFGDLAEFEVLDTRQYRSDVARCGGDPTCPEARDPARTMLGDEQERWLLDGLAASGARWNVIANQVPLREQINKVGGDKWDGYLAQRERLLSFLAEREPSNPVVVTGDAHYNEVADLLADFEDPASEIVGTEFIGTSISTGGDGAPGKTYNVEGQPGPSSATAGRGATSGSASRASSCRPITGLSRRYPSRSRP